MTSSSNELQATVEIAFIPADPMYPDKVALHAASQSVKQELINQGYTVQTGTVTRGGSILEVLVSIAEQAQQNKEFLLLLFGIGKTITDYLTKKQQERATSTEKPASKDSAQTVKVTIEIDDALMEIEAADAETAATLVERFQSTHSETATHASSKSKITITGAIPADEQ